MSFLRTTGKTLSAPSIRTCARLQLPARRWYARFSDAFAVMPSVTFVPHELRCMRQIRPLPLVTQREIVEDDRSYTVRASADAVIALIDEGI
jgi:hypothetical protein